MAYRTKTYIAGDWTGDRDAIEQLYKWNDSKHWSLSFTDAHSLTQARDNSLNCSIKKSLKTRMDTSKTFILIVGNKTNLLRSGSCSYCVNYNATFQRCSKLYSADLLSYIQYECRKAAADKLKIVVLYKSTQVDKSKCPETVRYIGNHVAMLVRKNGDLYWDYNAVKTALV